MDDNFKKNSEFYEEFRILRRIQKHRTAQFFALRGEGVCEGGGERGGKGACERAKGWME